MNLPLIRCASLTREASALEMFTGVSLVSLEHWNGELDHDIAIDDAGEVLKVLVLGGC